MCRDIGHPTLYAATSRRLKNRGYRQLVRGEHGDSRKNMLGTRVRIIVRKPSQNGVDENICSRFKHLIFQINWLAGGLGFEPRQAESESAVLPLDDPPLPGSGEPRRFAEARVIAAAFGLRKACYCATLIAWRHAWPTFRQLVLASSKAISLVSFKGACRRLRCGQRNSDACFSGRTDGRDISSTGAICAAAPAFGR